MCLFKYAHLVNFNVLVVESILRGEEIGITPRRRACNINNNNNNHNHTNNSSTQNSREIKKSNQNQNRVNKNSNNNSSTISATINANNSNNNSSNESLPGNDCEIAGKIKIKPLDESNIDSVMNTSDTSKSSVIDLSEQRHQTSEVSHIYTRIKY